MSIILAVESSCDETGVALYDTARGWCADELYSQIPLHQNFGGVVPELASRDHLRKLSPLAQTLLKKHRVKLNDIDAIGYTAGPGLMGALMVGAAWAHGVALSLKLPLIPVNHLEGHFMAAFLTPGQTIAYPFLGLLVSGGNTLLVAAQGFNQYQVLGSTLDDAVGELLDKVAKVMGLGYPGGAKLAKLAETVTAPNPIAMPIPMQRRAGLDFSFSGLKTCAIQLIEKLKLNHEWSDLSAANVAAALEEAAMQSIVLKVKKALNITKLPSLVVAGGVSANTCLRRKLQALTTALNVKLYMAEAKYCTDNAAMIAKAAAEHFARGEFIAPDQLQNILVNPRWKLGEKLLDN